MVVLRLHLDFITSLLPSMKDMGGMWIGLKLRQYKLESVDQFPVNYINFNPLLVGKHKAIAVNVSPPHLLSVPEH